MKEYTMANKDNTLEDMTLTSDTTDSTQKGFPNQLTSEQAGQTLRWLAEDIIRKNADFSQEGLKALSLEEMQHLLHELRVHQVELEIQNEELRRIQEEMEISKARYVDLYDFAPVGYLTVSEKGLILETNFTAAKLLGVSRSLLIKKPLTSIILPTDQDIYYLHRKALFETGAQQTCELRLQGMDSPPFWVLLQATLFKEHKKDEAVCRVVVTDINERKQAEEKLRIAYAELELRVQERTSQLSDANATLSVEIAEHKQADKDLRDYKKPELL
jgi:PAS domain S-box-containing protein